MKGGQKGSKVSAKQKAAGAANLRRWQKTEGHGLQRMTHGAYSRTIRQKYSDGRTSEGKKLQGILTALEDDLGGAPNLSAGQQLIIAGMRGKVIVLLQMSDYLDRQQSVIDKDGELSGFLKREYLTYCDSVGRDIERLYKLSGNGKRGNVPLIEDLIKANAK